MIVYLKNQKDNGTHLIAKVANTEGFEKFPKDSFDIFQVNEKQHLVIFKERLVTLKTLDSYLWAVLTHLKMSANR